MPASPCKIFAGSVSTYSMFAAPADEKSPRSA
jgi:hypothetical protein